MNIPEGMGTSYISTMDNQEALHSFAWLNNPLALPWHMVTMEVVYLACMVLVLIHSLRCYQKGDRAAPFTWLAAVVYGVGLETINASRANNFWHGEFTVMLFYNRLPLYIVASYTLVCFAVKTIQRFRMKALPEAFAVGLLMLAIDFMWENLGPQLGWWIWSDVDPAMAVRWWDSPVSCHLWQLLFSASFALINRKILEEWAIRRNAGLPGLVIASITVGLATVVCGILLLLPANLLYATPWAVHSLGVVWIAVALAVAASARREPVGVPDPLLRSVAGLLIGFYALIFVTVYGQAATILAGALALSGIIAYAHRRGDRVPAASPQAGPV